MKKNVILAAAFVLAVMAVSASAQKVTDFSGTWILDVAKSKLDARMPVESQVLVVAQTATDLKVETTTKTPPPPADSQGPPRGGRMMGADVARTYMLDGKAVKTTEQGRMGDTTVERTAKTNGAKLDFSTVRSGQSPRGEFKMTMTEIWDLSADGKTLTIEMKNESPMGSSSSTWIYTKKP